MDIDVEAAADGVPARPAAPVRRTAAFFDLDKTVIAKSSTLAFSRSFYQGGLINRRAVLRSAYAQFVYLVGGADHDQMERMREYLSGLVTGWDVQTVKDIVAETLHTIVDPIVYDEAVTLIDEHHLAGRDVVIVSSSGSEVVEPIGEMLGAEKVVATRMVVGEDGRFDGTIEFYAYGEAKAGAIRALAESAGYDLARSYAYSDSATDLPMLDAVGHPYAVNPDRALRRPPPNAGGRYWCSPSRWRSANVPRRSARHRSRLSLLRPSVRARLRPGWCGTRRDAVRGHREPIRGATKRDPRSRQTAAR